VLVAYGRLRKYIEKICDKEKIFPLSDGEFLDLLEQGSMESVTTLAVLGSDFAAIGGGAMRLRKAIELLDAPILIITETESLLKKKMPTHPNVTVVVERSKKPHVLKEIIDKHVNWELAASVPDGISNYGKTVKVEELGSTHAAQNEASTHVLAIEQDPAKDTILEEFDNKELDNKELKGSDKTKEPAVPEQLITDTKVPASTDKPSAEPIVQIINKEIVISKALYDFCIVELPKYAPLHFKDPYDILKHLRKKWDKVLR